MPFGEVPFIPFCPFSPLPPFAGGCDWGAPVGHRAPVRPRGPQADAAGKCPPLVATQVWWQMFLNFQFFFYQVCALNYYVTTLFDECRRTIVSVHLFLVALCCRWVPSIASVVVRLLTLILPCKVAYWIPHANSLDFNHTVPSLFTLSLFRTKPCNYRLMPKIIWILYLVWLYVSVKVGNLLCLSLV